MSKELLDLNGLGKRFYDASLPTIDFPEEIKNKINEWLENPNRFLVILGGIGVGKTYLCAAIMNHLQSKGEGWVQYESDPMIFSYPHYHMTDLSLSKFLIIDNIQECLSSDQRKEMFCLINSRYGDQTPTILVSHLSKEEFIMNWGPAISDRIFAKESVQISIELPSRR